MAYTKGGYIMKRLILRMYKTPKEDIKKFDLICKYRYVYYDYVNNYITSAGIPEEENKKRLCK